MTHIQFKLGSSNHDKPGSDDALSLEPCLQSEFEEDIARVFDESLYSDLELVCGRSKIKTHTCILKARTKKFYQKLENILQFNITKNTYDEIYSFISDVYTECNIENQEKEIIEYLNEHYSKNKIVGEEAHDSGVFINPDKSATQEEVEPVTISESNGKSVSSSPSIELTKEYYALVPIDNQAIEKELVEQDGLPGGACSSLTQQGYPDSEHKKQLSLSLSSSRKSESTLHSDNCDFPRNKCARSDLKIFFYESPVKSFPKSYVFNQECPVNVFEKGKTFDLTTSPDSFTAGENSSSSDYVSAAFNISPESSISKCYPRVASKGQIVNMDHTFVSSDSGLEHSGFLESLNDPKDLTTTESTLQDITEDASHTSSPSVENLPHQRIHLDSLRHAASFSSTSSEREFADGPNRGEAKNTLKENVPGKSSKEEKQRQNEEIVILESSSISSETGSWESVFPPKLATKEANDSELITEISVNESHAIPLVEKKPEDLKPEILPEIVNKPAVKSAFCFIDASSLADEEDKYKIRSGGSNQQTLVDQAILPIHSQPVPCSTVKQDASPNDCSESYDNEDSLEQLDAKDPDSLQKDLSPTIFEMTPITEDSLSALPYENVESTPDPVHPHTINKNDTLVSTVVMSVTPHNSIMSVRTVKRIDSEGDSDSTLVSYEGSDNVAKLRKFADSSPIVSGGASIEDHLPQISSVHSGSPLGRRKVDNIPIISGAYVVEEKANKIIRKPAKSVNSSWVIDMSKNFNVDDKIVEKAKHNVKKPGDRTCESLRNESSLSLHDSFCKSRSSIDSDNSDKSSHKFFVDFDNLPDAVPDTYESANEKKNIFSMYIDIGSKSTVKEMPARLSLSLNAKRNVKQIDETKKTVKSEISVTKLNNEQLEDFEQFETYCSNLDMTVSDIISVTSKCSLEERASAEKDNSEIVNNEQQLNDETSENFVRLSDLDKPSPKLRLDSSSVIFENTISDKRMTRSIPDNNWEKSCHNRNSDVISSFYSENALSLNRLFPHLITEFSRSMPGSLSNRTRSPMAASTGQVENEQASDVSVLSSVQSSYCRSIPENSTTEETSSLIGNCQSKLGQDLLRMFLEEIAPDVIVEVSGKRFKAHKCILSSRCQYFAGILSGGWVESAGNVIVLPPFSHNVVHFALCHIYSGLSTIPDTISIVELATIADMLGLEGLKEAIMFTLKAKYCHHFHKPCSVCTAGVLECFPLSSVYGLDDLYRKCLKWITKYFHKVWPTKAFATLPKELLDKCYQEHVINMTTDNVVDTVCSCGITVLSLYKARWADTVAAMCRRVLEAAAQFSASQLPAVVARVAEVPADLPPPAADALDHCFAVALDWATPTNIANAYEMLSQVVKELRSTNVKSLLNGDGTRYGAPINFLQLRAADWKALCERAYDRSAPSSIDKQVFKDLPQELKKRLRDHGCIVYESPTTRSMQEKKTQRNGNLPTRSTKSYIATGRNFDIEHVRQSFVPYAAKPALHLKSNDNLKSSSGKLNRSAYSPMLRIRTTKAQEERAKFNTNQKTTQDRGSTNTLSGRKKYENTKPRYLEPRVNKETDKKLPMANKLNPKMISSSESSRNSSPIQARKMRMSRTRAGRDPAHCKSQAMSQDSLATSTWSRPRTAEPSTESLSESQQSHKYATYTKTKKTQPPTEDPEKSKSSVKSAIKTKIPVYVNNVKNRESIQRRLHNGTSRSVSKQPDVSVPVANAQHTKVPSNRCPGSLMMATKASSAKIVNRPRKEQIVAPTKPTKGKGKADAPAADTRPLPEIPLMERSGTFLKEEPTFGDKTTYIDIAQEGSA